MLPNPRHIHKRELASESPRLGLRELTGRRRYHQPFQPARAKTPRWAAPERKPNGKETNKLGTERKLSKCSQSLALAAGNTAMTGVSENSGQRVA